MATVELTASEIEYLRANYGRLTNREIAAHLYVGPTTVPRLVRRYDIAPVTGPATIKKGSQPGRGRPWTPEDNELLLSMIDARYTYTEIAAALRRTTASVVEYKSLRYPDYPSPPHQSSIRRGKNHE